jgi:ATP-binding protein involved in chromosome partitioning
MAKVDIKTLLQDVEYPLLARTLGELGIVGAAQVSKLGKASAVIRVPFVGHPLDRILQDDISEALKDVKGVKSVNVEFVEMDEAEKVALMAGMSGTGVAEQSSATRVISVASGKGGVGKSSVTANLAVALARRGLKVGVMDADVWGFSIPGMLNAGPSPVIIGESIVPPQAHGVKVMSMDYFVGDDKAVIWRGPMLHKAMEQFIKDVFWDAPDFLLVDTPPGTGDVAISLSQFLPRAQILLVTTPQPTAQKVARRAALMAKEVKQEVVGVIENMSWFTGDDGVRYEIFGSGGGQELADELGVPLLGKLPLLPALRSGADEGRPIHEVDEEGELAKAFDALAASVVGLRPRVRTHPDLVIR